MNLSPMSSLAPPVRAGCGARKDAHTKQHIEKRLRPEQGALLHWLIEQQDKDNLSAEWSAFIALLESFG